MRFRKLRIAWSVGCGILCVLLIVLWVRSYWWRPCYWSLSLSLSITSISKIAKQTFVATNVVLEMMRSILLMASPQAGEEC